MLKFLRKDLLLLLMIAAVFLSLSYAIGYVSDRSPTTVEGQPAFLEGSTPKPQPTTGRVWKDPTFEKSLALGPANLTNPLIIQVDNTGNIYALDWDDFKIKMFSPDGKLLRAFGEGKGSLPGAFVNPTAFSVRPGGEVWVCDPKQRSLTRFTPDGKAQVVTPQNAVDRIAAVGDTLITMVPPGGDSLFEIYNLSGERLKSFGTLVENQSEQGIALDGNVVIDHENQGFVYGGRYLGVIAGYDANGKQRFIARTIDDTPLPKVLNTEGKFKLKASNTQPIQSMSIDGNNLYVLSGISFGGKGSTGGQVVDVYNTRDGNYLYSLKLPVACQEAIVHANNLYTLGRKGITVWRFKQSA